MAVQYAKKKPKSVAKLRAEFWESAPEALLSRAITAAGVARSIGWMELKASKGGGIPFLKNGKRVLYRKADTLAWLEANSQLVSSTSEYKLAPAALPWKEGGGA
jgi:hypothetical protein